MINQARKQKSEQKVFKIKCPGKNNLKCAEVANNNSMAKLNYEPLTKDEEDEVTRLAIKMPMLTSCHYKYLLGIDKCIAIHEHLTWNSHSFSKKRKQETEGVEIFKLLNKNSWNVERRTFNTKNKNK